MVDTLYDSQTPTKLFLLIVKMCALYIWKHWLEISHKAFYLIKAKIVENKYIYEQISTKISKWDGDKNVKKKKKEFNITAIY